MTVDPVSGRVVGRQGVPSMAELAADAGTSRARGGETVEHHCPECGLSQVWVPCLVCGGRKVLTDDELTRYLAVQERGGLRSGG